MQRGWARRGSAACKRRCRRRAKAIPAADRREMRVGSAFGTDNSGGIAGPDRCSAIRGVIFDLDGVLVATDRLHALAWRRLAEEKGLGVHRDQIRRLAGLGRDRSLEVLLETAGRSYSPSDRAAMAERKNVIFLELAAALNPGDVLPGVVHLLDELRDRGVKTAVASSSRNAPMVLAAVGLADRFAAIVDGNDASSSKPDPELFLLAAERIGIEPRRCLVVEDSLPGIQGARHAGMAVVAVGSAACFSGMCPTLPSLAGVTADGLLRAAG